MPVAKREDTRCARHTLFQMILPAIFICLNVLPNFAWADVVVVRPQAWQAALQKWKDYRQQQGHRFWELDSELGPVALGESIRKLAGMHAITHVVLAGDVQAGVGTFYHPSTALVQFGGTDSLASDHDFGDLDNDGVPDIAVGRVPAGSEAQLRSFLDRVIAYESNDDFSSWRRDVHVVAGVGGFGVVTDSIIELTTRKFLSETVPPWVNLSMTQASLSSLYCPDPLSFSKVTLERMNEGSAFWVYIGHGWVDQLDVIRVGKEAYPIFTAKQIPDVGTQRPPIAIFLACFTGAIDATQHCLASQLVLAQDGPIAAIAASRVSGPYGLAILSDGLLRGYYEQQLPNVGELLLQAKRASLDDERFTKSASAESRLGVINSIASAMTPKGYDLKAERQEHVWQMNLLGDPLMRLNYGQKLQVDCDGSSVVPGQNLQVQIQSQLAGNLSVEFAVRRGVPQESVRQVQTDWRTPEGRQGYNQRYQLANSQVLASVSVPIQPGLTTVQLPVPEKIRVGRYLVRAFLQSDQAYKVGSTEVQIDKPRS